jgi:hypothetical protein
VAVLLLLPLLLLLLLLPLLLLPLLLLSLYLAALLLPRRSDSSSCRIASRRMPSRLSCFRSTYPEQWWSRIQQSASTL